MTSVSRRARVAGRRTQSRKLAIERFESRQLMASDLSMPLSDTLPHVGAIESNALWLTSQGNRTQVLRAEGEGSNQAPVITAGAVVNLPSITEDQNFPSPDWRGVFMVSTLLRSAGYTDADNTNSLFGSGIAITGIVGRGYLAYATELNGNWIRIPAVSQTNALLLATNFYSTSTGALYPQWLCYVPDGSNGEDVTINFRAWDLTSGTPSNKTPISMTAMPRFGDASINGGSTAFSAELGIGRISVTSLNDAPVIGENARITLPVITENAPSAPTLVGTLLNSAGIADRDIGALSGMAITSVSGNGRWQFSTDGFSWTNVGTVGSSSALLLSPSTRLRYQPDLLNGEQVTLTFRAWDMTTGSASSNGVPVYGDTTLSGGTSAYSASSGSVNLTVTSVNDAPVITSGAVVRFVATNENRVSGARTVDSILTASGWSDVDTGASRGMAILATAGLGSWQYSTDGITWTGVGPVSSTTALLLSGTSRLRYAPDMKNGETARLIFKAWDMTSGVASTNTARSLLPASPSGGIRAFSSSNAQAIVQVVGFNDAPTITPRYFALPGTDEDTISPPFPVGSILDAFSWNDVDFGALRGMAVIGSSGVGIWQYSTDGISWTDFGQVSRDRALLLNATTQVRFAPDPRNAISGNLQILAWDQTTGVASTNELPSYANAWRTGDTTAFSSAFAFASMNVRWLNDAPTITADVVVNLPTTNENVGSASIVVSDVLAASNYDDPDHNSVPGLAIVGLTGNGTWQYSTSGAVWTSFFTASEATALVLSNTTRLRYLPDGNNGETATLRYRAWNETVPSADGSPRYADASIVGGTSNFSVNVGTISVQVESVNDAPTITPMAAITIPVRSFDSVTTPFPVSDLLSAGNWSDVDSGAFSGIAVVGKATGGWWQYSVDGITWTLLPDVSESSALLLSPTTLLRCWLNLLGGGHPVITFRAWDQTSGTSSTDQQMSLADVALSGGSSAYSAATASVTVRLVNN